MSRLTHDYASDLETRLAATTSEPTTGMIDNLVFAEGHLLNIHPFEDFNGRVTRLFLIELTCRLELPNIELAALTNDRDRYFAALRAYDRRDLRSLAAIWRERFGHKI